MELKLGGGNLQPKIIELLIVPYGIETTEYRAGLPAHVCF